MQSNEPHTSPDDPTGTLTNPTLQALGKANGAVGGVNLLGIVGLFAYTVLQAPTKGDVDTAVDGAKDMLGARIEATETKLGDRIQVVESGLRRDLDRVEKKVDGLPPGELLARVATLEKTIVDLKVQIAVLEKEEDG